MHNTPRLPPHPPGWLASWRLVGLLLVSGLLTVGLWLRVAPFPLAADDVGYLTQACQPGGALHTLAWGPAYTALYCGLVQLLPDLATAFALKQAAVVLLQGLLLGWLMHTLAVPPVLAAGSGLWIIHIALATNGTSEFAFVLALLAAIVAQRGGVFRWVGFFGLLGLAFFVRTEYALGVPLGLLGLGWQLWQRRAHPAAGPVPLYAGLVVGLGVGIGCAALFLLTTGASNRSWFAFSQHFALNYSSAFHIPGDPWTETRRIVAPAFPASQSIADALRENPAMVAWHIGYNLARRLPAALLHWLAPAQVIAELPRLVVVLFGGATLMVAGSAMLLAVRAGQLRDQRLLPLYSLLPIPLVSLLIMPEARHLQPWLPLAALLVCRGVQAAPRYRRLMLAACVALLAVGQFTTTALLGYTLQQDQPSVAQQLASVRQEVSASQPMRVLTSWYGERVCALVGTDRCVVLNYVSGMAAGETLTQYAQRMQAGWLLTDAEWPASLAVQRDPQALALLQQPAQFGCVAWPATREGMQLLACGSALAYRHPQAPAPTACLNKMARVRVGGRLAAGPPGAVFTARALPSGAIKML